MVEKNHNARRDFLKLSTLGLGSLIISPFLPTKSNLFKGFANVSSPKRSPIKSFCIDFNWGKGCLNGFAMPGLWADADPSKHIQWYEALGCNIIQTFAVSSNGYAWYKNGIIPQQPGLKYDFLPKMVQLGHDRKMKVFGYFCVGANTKWGLDHPDLSYGIPSEPHIPLTTRYLDYLCSSIEDALLKTSMNGFMLDWVWNPKGATRWLKCEQEMFNELMHRPFPGKDKITDEIDLQYRRKAIDRCWKRVMELAKKVSPNCIIWLSTSGIRSGYTINSPMYKQVDWLMNEGGSISDLNVIKDMIGSKTRLIACLANWNKKDPLKLIPAAVANNIGLYSFSKPQSPDISLPFSINTYLTKPINSFSSYEDRNVAALARFYNGLPFNYIKK